MTTSSLNDVVIIGGGQAAAHAAMELREFGHLGRITVIGDEAHMPYERPPLSKAILVGAAAPEKAAIFADAAYAAANVQFLTNQRVERIDRSTRRVMLAGAGAFTYDRLILAMGAETRDLPVPGADASSVHYLRRMSDCLTIRERIRPGSRVALIGGGFIGMELASSARALGADVDVIEAGPRLMARGLIPQVSTYLHERHLEQGVRVHCGRQVVAIGKHATLAVHLDNGQQIEADLIVAGIGIVPCDRLATECGLDTADGILVDAAGRTSDPYIHACGDVARYRSHAGMPTHRLETWQHAIDSGRIVAADCCGKALALANDRWFWTDQAGVNVQCAGIYEEGQRLVTRGNPEEGRFITFATQGGRVTALNAVNGGRDMRFARALLRTPVHVEPERLGDVAVPLRQLAEPA